jgi:hypothetical protein
MAAIRAIPANGLSYGKLWVEGMILQTGLVIALPMV